MSISEPSLCSKSSDNCGASLLKALTYYAVRENRTQLLIVCAITLHINVLLFSPILSDSVLSVGYQ